MYPLKNILLPFSLPHGMRQECIVVFFLFTASKGEYSHTCWWQRSCGAGRLSDGMRSHTTAVFCLPQVIYDCLMMTIARPTLVLCGNEW